MTNDNTEADNLIRLLESDKSDIVELGQQIFRSEGYKYFLDELVKLPDLAQKRIFDSCFKNGYIPPNKIDWFLELPFSKLFSLRLHIHFKYFIPLFNHSDFISNVTEIFNRTNVDEVYITHDGEIYAYFTYEKTIGKPYKCISNEFSSTSLKRR